MEKEKQPQVLENKKKMRSMKNHKNSYLMPVFLRSHVNMRFWIYYDNGNGLCVLSSLPRRALPRMPFIGKKSSINSFAAFFINLGGKKWNFLVVVVLRSWWCSKNGNFLLLAHGNLLAILMCNFSKGIKIFHIFFFRASTAFKFFNALVRALAFFIAKR